MELAARVVLGMVLLGAYVILERLNTPVVPERPLTPRDREALTRALDHHGREAW